MINQSMFSDFMANNIASCTAFLDRSMFHLDGEEATHSLDVLLDMDDLDAIQFQQGSSCYGIGKIQPPPIAPFIPMLKRIQEAGKGVYISIPLEEVELVMRELSSKRLFIGLSADSEQEAKDVEKRFAKITHD